MVNFGGFLWISAESRSHGTELFAFDGRILRMAGDTSPGIGSSSPSDLTPLNGLLYFAAMGEALGREIYFVDPRAAPDDPGYNATLVVDALPGFSSSGPSGLCVY